MNIDELNKEQFDAFINDYYNSESSIKKVLEKYNINKTTTQKVIDLLPDIESSSICEYCDTKMIYAQKSRTVYKENFRYIDEVCPQCNHKIINSAFGKKICNCDNCTQKRYITKKEKDNLKLESLKKMIENTESKAINIDELKLLSLSKKTSLLTLLMYLYDESNHSFKQIDLLNGIKFAPTIKYGFSIINDLLDCSLIKFKITQNTLDRITFKENGHYSYPPYSSDYKLNIKYSELFNFAEVVKKCEYIYSCNLQEIKEEALEIWKEIGLHELKEYIYYLFEKYNFDTDYIGDAIIEKLELILEDFSVSQGYAILYNAVTGAASYKQTGITHKHAVNSINTLISNNIAKRKSGEWDTKGYKRNFDLPQTAISMVFFNNILKIGDKGFEQVPKIENIPDSFIDELEIINFENISTSAKLVNDTRLELLETLDTLTKNQYSFGEVFDLLNRALNVEGKILRQTDDFEILQKLKTIQEFSDDE